MYEFIKKKFIRDYKNVADKNVRLSYGLTAGVCGILSNLLLCVLKAVFGIMSGSISMVADAVNNLSDAGSSVVTVFGFKMSGKSADEKHPFGHARYEYITALVVSFMVLAIGLVLGYKAVLKIITPEEVDAGAATFAVLGLAVIAKIWQAGLYKNFGKSIDSEALLASAADSKNDVLSTVAVLLGLVLAKIWPTVPFDAIFGLAVSALIVASGVKLVRETVDPLLGTLPTKELVEKIKSKVLSYDGILGVHDMVIHNYGPANVYVTLHAEVDAKVDVTVSHDLVDNIERDFMKEDGYFVVIHMDPVRCDDEEALALKEKISSYLKDNVRGDVTVHDFRLVRGVTHTNVLFDVVLPYGLDMTAGDVVKLLEGGKIGEEGHNYYYIVNVDKSYVK